MPTLYHNLVDGLTHVYAHTYTFEKRDRANSDIQVVYVWMCRASAQEPYAVAIVGPVTCFLCVIAGYSTQVAQIPSVKYAR